MSAPPINPEALTIARESRGRTQQEIADATGITQGLISKAEHGLTSIALDDMKRVASYLDYPVRLFYERAPIREAGSACLYHRKRKTLPAKPLKRLEARMHIRNLNVSKLLDNLEIAGDRGFHSIDPDEYGGSGVEVARALRSAWRLPDGPIPNLTALIESAGGVVIAEPFGTRKLFGMSCWTHHGHPLFFLNSEMPTEVLRWTIAHELGHLTMHGVAPQPDPEEQADAFAGEFLAPQTLLRPDLRKLDFNKLPALKAHWRISMKALIKRAQVLGVIDKPASVRLYKQYSARRYNVREPYPLPPEPSTIRTEAIRVYLDDHDYTPNEVAEAMLLSFDEFQRDLMKGPQRYSNVVSLFDPQRANG
jgi:Zn-dependent peptidase ImmA (M78 family)/transcriptional regulator with XRE-family HTH domain